MKPVELLNPMVDVIFKSIFGDPKNTDLLSAFIQSVLNREADEFAALEITDTNLKAQAKDDKIGILDVKAYTKSGKVIDIEVQVLFVPQLRERIIFYMAKMISEQLSRGKKYDQIKQVISIVILDFKLIKEDEAYHHTYRLYDQDHQLDFSDVLEIHILELPKISLEEESPSESEDLSDWLRFLKSRKKEEFTMLAERSPMLQKAYEELERLSQDKTTGEIYESRLKAKRDEVSRLEGAEEKGRRIGRQLGEQIGRQQGEQKKALEIARNMVSRGMPISDIAVMTGLTEEEVSAIQSSQ